MTFIIAILHLNYNMLAIIVGKIIWCIKLIEMGIVVIVPEHPWGYFLPDESLYWDAYTWSYGFTILMYVT